MSGVKTVSLGRTGSLKDRLARKLIAQLGLQWVKRDCSLTTSVEEDRTLRSAEFGMRSGKIRIHYSALACGAVAQLVER